jgi:hypothetical protein
MFAEKKEMRRTLSREDKSKYRNISRKVALNQWDGAGCEFTNYLGGMANNTGIFASFRF